MTTNFPLITTSDKKLTLSNVKISGFKNIVRNAGTLGVNDGNDAIVNFAGDGTGKFNLFNDIKGSGENITGIVYYFYMLNSHRF